MQHLQPNTTLQGGKYRIERVLGQGGFGITYVGYNTEFEETVAIKEFFMKGVTERDESTRSVRVSNAENVHQFEEQRGKFKKEARRLRKLKNEHIVKVHDLFEENGTAYYVMEYIDGESLAERMKRIGQPLAEQEVRSILQQILEALEEVHRNEMWHLDLKPGNIMLDKQGNSYLIDFGASKQIRADGSITTSTALCYTPGYAPNEQVGQMYDRFGPWTDFYALGATVYNLLTNQKPPMAIDIEEDEKDAFAFPSSISKEMRSLVVWMMQPKRKARPQSVEELFGKLTKDQTIVIAPQEPIEIQEGVEVEEKNTDVVDEGTVFVTDAKEDKSPALSETLGSIRIGDFIYDDGSNSDSEVEDKNLIGVLFSYQGGERGQIVSVEPHAETFFMGKKLNWHIASIAEWIKIIENLGKDKVTYQSNSYVFFSKDVLNNLRRYKIDQEKYLTKRHISGVTYLIKLTDNLIAPFDNDGNDIPHVYVAEI